MQPGLKSQLDFQYPGWRYRLKWNGDNSEMVVDVILPLMTWLDPDVRRVIEWAYGCGSDPSYEIKSDGSTRVSNRFFDGLAKDPHGVGHDYLHWLHYNRMADPSRRIWTFREAADWYQRASEQFGDGVKTSWVRRLGLDIFGWVFWKYPVVKRKKFKR